MRKMQRRFALLGERAKILLDSACPGMLQAYESKKIVKKRLWSRRDKDAGATANRWPRERGRQGREAAARQVFEGWLLTAFGLFHFHGLGGKI
jgi:hypothetical protein